MGIFPLIALWALTQGQGGGLQWPGRKAPPPDRLPNRKAAPASGKHAKPPKPHKGDRVPTSQISPAHEPDAAPAVPSPVAPPQALHTADTPPASEAPALGAVSVLNVQKLINKLGARPALKQDGLFGPKTVGAWRALSNQRGLDPTIVRIGPKTVDVSPQTYARLNAGRMVSGYDPPLYIP